MIVIILRVLTLVVIAILDIERTTVKKTEMIIMKRKTRHVARSAVVEVVEVVWQCGGLVVSCGGNVVLVLVLVLAPALALALVLVWYWCVVLVCGEGEEEEEEARGPRKGKWRQVAEVEHCSTAVDDVLSDVRFGGGWLLFSKTPIPVERIDALSQSELVTQKARAIQVVYADEGSMKVRKLDTVELANSPNPGSSVPEFKDLIGGSAQRAANDWQPTAGDNQPPPEKSLEVKPLEKKKQGIRKNIRDLERDVAFACAPEGEKLVSFMYLIWVAEEDQERTEARLAKHKAQRVKLLAEIDEICQQVKEGKQNQVCAARDRLKAKVTLQSHESYLAGVNSEAQELQIVEVELKRASMELESAREEKLHLDVQIFHQREENNALKGEHQRLSLEVPLLAFVFWYPQAALKDLIDGLGTLTSSLVWGGSLPLIFKPPSNDGKTATVTVTVAMAAAMMTTMTTANADSEHGRLAATQVLVTGPPEIVKGPRGLQAPRALGALRYEEKKEGKKEEEEAGPGDRLSKTLATSRL
ncbi:hypothetical protein AK812_SmicGene12415 [Symbiodinium microadriaticum]|uniref:Uncharacterized protein n=1 Tax=Symbiodinium microadriaticum TaxID=2951 RepID=A0A1Q9EAM0_SYMMI|nr:hypothetical protein AK812_SmicGene12415 [Symbiodinium microadriaticum]